MNKPIFTKSPSGEEIVILPREEYEELIRQVEDTIDINAVKRFDALMAKGEMNLTPLSKLDH